MTGYFIAGALTLAAFAAVVAGYVIADRRSERDDDFGGRPFRPGPRHAPSLPCMAATVQVAVTTARPPWETRPVVWQASDGDHLRPGQWADETNSFRAFYDAGEAA